MCWRISTDRAHARDEYGVIIRNLFQQNGFQAECIEAMIISSVVPPLHYPLEKMAQKYFKTSPLIVGPGIKTGLNILMDNPQELGADRVVNAVGAIELYGGPLIIVDFGTATTFCAVSERRNIWGELLRRGFIFLRRLCFKEQPNCPV